MYDCFISYKVGADNELAHDFSSFLKDDDFSVFIDSKGLLPGTKWSDELALSMENSNHVLAFFTEDYVARIEEGNADGQNFIIEELNWALKDKKLIPISIGLPVSTIEEKCVPWISALKGIQFIAFEDKNSVQYQTILNQLNKLIRTRKKHALLTPSSATHLNIHELHSEQAYLKLMMPWTVNEALKYKADLENKFLKEPIDYVVLAKFYLIGRFGIKIDPEMAYQHLRKAALNNCRAADFELGVLHGFEETKYGGDEDKATEYYTKAHQAGDIRATYRLALLFDENIENSNCPTQFLKNKYGIASSNEFINHIFEQSANYTNFNSAEKYSFCLAQIHADENKEQAIQKIEQLASEGYLSAVFWLGYEYSRKESAVIQNVEKSLTYLHAGDEQDNTWCRNYLACIYLETEYRELGFEENIPLGIEKHLKNISVNAFESAYDLAWVLENRPELQKHISIDKQITFLEKAVEFGQLNCREFLAKAYIKAKRPSLGAFAIKSAQQGYFEPTSLILAEFAINTNFKDVISKDDYLTLYALIKKEIQAASPKRALNLNIALMNLAMCNNRLQDALDLVELISEENRKEGACYYYAKQVALKYRSYCYSQRLVFELLKKGAIYTYEVKIIDDKPTGIYKDTCKEENSARWLLSILLGRVNPCYKSYLMSLNFDESFVAKLLDVTHHTKFSDSFEYVDDNQKLQNTSIPPIISHRGNIGLSFEISKRRACEQQLIASGTNKTSLLHAYAYIGYASNISPSYKILEKSAFDLGTACYKKLFSESKNKNGYIPQSALFIHLINMSESDNIDNNKEHIEYCFNNIVATLTSEEGDLEVYLDSFKNLCGQFLNTENINSYEELTNILYSALNQLLFLIVNTYVYPEKFDLVAAIFDGIQHLSANNIQQSVLRDKLLFDLGCLYIALYPSTSIAMDMTCINNSSHILVFNLYNKYDDFKFNQITKMEAVPKSIIRMLKVATEENPNESENTMLEAARSFLKPRKPNENNRLDPSEDAFYQQAKTIVRAREFKQFTKRYN
jgi:TPR repeat protein